MAFYHYPADDKHTDLFNPADGWKDTASETSSTSTSTSATSGERSRGYTFDDYQLEAGTTAVYPDHGEGTPAAFAYLCLKLNGEAGEVGEAFAKYLRGDYEVEECKRRVGKELGDVLWYCAQLATELDVKLSDTATDNIRKLADRANRGVIRGSGDDR